MGAAARGGEENAKRAGKSGGMDARMWMRAGIGGRMGLEGRAGSAKGKILKNEKNLDRLSGVFTCQKKILESAQNSARQHAQFPSARLEVPVGRIDCTKFRSPDIVIVQPLLLVPSLPLGNNRRCIS